MPLCTSFTEETSSTSEWQQHRKRKSSDRTASTSKRPRRETSDSELECGGFRNFEPSSLVTSREGTFKAPRPMRKYLEKHLRRCLPKEEREAMFREHLKPDLPVCSPPKVDKYMSDFLGNKMPKDYDREFLKAQAAVLACVRPLASAW